MYRPLFTLPSVKRPFASAAVPFTNELSRADSNLTVASIKGSPFVSLITPLILAAKVVAENKSIAITAIYLENNFIIFLFN